MAAPASIKDEMLLVSGNLRKVATLTAIAALALPLSSILVFVLVPVLSYFILRPIYFTDSNLYTALSDFAIRAGIGVIGALVLVFFLALYTRHMNALIPLKRLAASTGNQAIARLQKAWFLTCLLHVPIAMLIAMAALIFSIPGSPAYLEYISTLNPLIYTIDNVVLIGIVCLGITSQAVLRGRWKALSGFFPGKQGTEGHDMIVKAHTRGLIVFMLSSWGIIGLAMINLQRVFPDTPSNHVLYVILNTVPFIGTMGVGALIGILGIVAVSMYAKGLFRISNSMQENNIKN